MTFYSFYNNSFFLFLLLFFFTACQENSTDSPSPSPQSIVVEIQYNGTAESQPFKDHKLRFFLNDNNGNTLLYKDYQTRPSKIKTKKTFTLDDNVTPGNYYVEGYWDWNDDGTQDSFEPITNPNPKFVEVKGFETEMVNIEIVDRTSPNDNGWIEGHITYNGTTTGYYHLYVAIQDANYNIINEKKVTGDFAPTNLSGGFDYISGKVQASIYYRVFAFWDVDGSGNYSSGDIDGDWAGTLIISPGLPTAGINFALR